MQSQMDSLCFLLQNTCVFVMAETFGVENKVLGSYENVEL